MLRSRSCGFSQSGEPTVKILLTGGTGFLGKYLVKLLQKEAETLYLLIRSKHQKKLQKKYADHPNIKLVLGDISNPDLFDDESLAKQMMDEVDSIVHAAAYYDLQGSYSSSFLYNVVGTQNVLYFARNVKNLKYFHHISTIAVAGDFEGSFPEDELERNQNFDNHYAKTKYDSEYLVRTWDLGVVKKRIYRLGVLTGDSETGSMSKVDGPYYFFKFIGGWRQKIPHLDKLKVIPLPYKAKSIFPLIPVDHAAHIIAEGVLQASQINDSHMRCYHVIGEQCPTMGEFVSDTFKTFGIKAKILEVPKNPLNAPLFKKIGIPPQLLEYMYLPSRFDTRNLTKDFKAKEKSLYSNYKKSLFDFAKKEF